MIWILLILEKGKMLKQILLYLKDSFRSALPGDALRGYAVFWHNLFNLHTFRI